MRNSLSRLRIPSLSAYATLATLAVSAGVACSATTDSSGEGTIKTSQAINDGLSCDTVTLTAKRLYQPAERIEGTFSFAGGAMKFQIPAEIPVTEGNAGRGRAFLTLKNGSDKIVCVYKGNLNMSSYDADDDEGFDSECGGDGSKYVLRNCKKPNRDFTAGDVVQASNFNLEVRRGLKSAGTTTAVLAIPELRPCDSITRGDAVFHDRELTGLGANGRACSDCHLDNDATQLSPASAEARWQALQLARQTDPTADDPLFRPIDADDFRVNGAAASDYSNVRQNGLIRITFPLPAGWLLVNPATGAPTAETFVDIWRAVPPVTNVKLTGPEVNGLPWLRGPNLRGGYQLDARVGTLQEQALGAFTSHAQAAIAPSQAQLDDVSAFQNNLFSSEGVRAAAAAAAAGLPPVDPDPVLDATEQEGKAIFNRACGQCHGTLGQSNPGAVGLQRFGGIQAQCPRPVDGINPQTGLPTFPGYTGTPRWNFDACAPTLARNVRIYQFARPNGEITRRPSSDPGRSLLTGFASAGAGAPPLVPGAIDDWGALDVPSVRNMKNTAPYFHNNSAATIDDVLDHYEEFFKFVGALAPPPPAPRVPLLSTNGVNVDRPFSAAERPALKAYLMKL